RLLAWMTRALLGRGGRGAAVEPLRSAPRETASAFDVMTETLAAYARACLAAGADGGFYATNMATKSLVSPEECRLLQPPYGLRVLDAANAAPFNLLHVCGTGIHFDEFADYPATAFSWATVPGNPSLDTVHVRTGKAVVGGLPAKPEIASMTAEELGGRARRGLGERRGRGARAGAARWTRGAGAGSCSAPTARSIPTRPSGSWTRWATPSAPPADGPREAGMATRHVNGQAPQGADEPDIPLLWVLRE